MNNKAFLLFEENKCHSLEKLLLPRKWDFAEFSKPNLPVKVGEIKNRNLFSARGIKPIRVLDMPIQFPGQGMRLPPECAQFRETIKMAVEHERVVNPDINNCYAYITIDQKPVAQGHSQRRNGWHSDAFLTDRATGKQVDVTAENSPAISAATGRLVDRTYLAYDCLPTLFCAGPWSVSSGIENDCEAVLQSFEQTVKFKPVVTYPAYTVLRIDPFDVHCVACNETGHLIERTFVKVAFSYEKYNRAGNTHNFLFNYEWEMIPRDGTKREHRFV